jgi:hypothetical protein
VVGKMQSDLISNAQIKTTRRRTVREPNSFLERFAPFGFNAWREKQHEFDVVVTGHNPILTMIVLKQALALGLSCLLTSEHTDDEWPYDLASHPNTVAILAPMLGLKISRYGSADRFLLGLVEEFIEPAAGLVTILDKSLALSVLSRQHEGELSLGTHRRRIQPAVGTEKSRYSGYLTKATERSPLIASSAKGELFVFTARAVLTGRSSSFAPCTQEGFEMKYVQDRIYPVGTAKTLAANDVARAEMMVSDFITCTRFEF